MKKVKIIHILLLLFMSITFYAQNKSVGIGTLTPNPSAALHVESTNQGFMMPHLTNTQIMAIVSPMNGLIVYSVTDSCYWFYKASHWDKICGTQHIVNNYIYTDTLVADSAYINILSADSIITNYITTHYFQTDSLVIGNTPISTYVTNIIDTTAWLLNGNDSVKATNFIGPKNAADFIVKTHNIERMRILSGGSIGINTNAPTNNLDINGGFRMRPGAAFQDLMISDALGNGTWQAPSTILTPPNLNLGAWTILGNTGIDAAINFLGTTDTGVVVYKQNNIGRMFIKAAGKTGFAKFATRTYIGTFVGYPNINPFSELDVNGNITMRNGSNNGDIIQGDVNGTMSWVTPASILTPPNLNLGAWTIIGNSLTNAATNFVGTTDAVDFVVRTNNVPRFRFNTGSQLFAYGTSLFNPSYSFNGAPTWGFGSDGTTEMYLAIRGEKGIVLDTAYNIFCSTINGGGGSPGTLTKVSRSMLLGDHNTLNTLSACNINGGFNTISNLIYSNVNGNANNIAGNAGTCVVHLSGQGNSLNLTTSPNSTTFVMGNGHVITAGATAGLSVLIGANNVLNATAGGSILIGGSIRSSHSGVTGLGGVSGIGIITSIRTGDTYIAGNGVEVYSSAGMIAGVTLAPGGGAWASISDRNVKENIVNINENDILKKLNAIPVTEWTYISQRPDTINLYDKTPVHIGPMAQDFAVAFGYGEYTDKITSSDIDGVLFAAIKALSKKNDETDQLKNDVAKLSNDVEELKKQMELLKELLKK